MTDDGQRHDMSAGLLNETSAAQAKALKADVARLLSTALADPLMHAIDGQDWQMQLSERAAMLYILDRLKPDVSIEIGTARCGSLRPIAATSRTVYTLDLAPITEASEPLFENVTFVTGDSAATLPPLIDQLNASDRQVNFILVDGSHDEEGVRADLIQCLRYRPRGAGTVIVMHDSANPAVRQGIARAPWRECPFVHALDMDFIPGLMQHRADLRGQIWGGLALAVMLPTPRTGDIAVQGTFAYSRHLLLQHAVQGPPAADGTASEPA